MNDLSQSAQLGRESDAHPALHRVDDEQDAGGGITLMFQHWGEWIVPDQGRPFYEVTATLIGARVHRRDPLPSVVRKGAAWVKRNVEHDLIEAARAKSEAAGEGRAA